MRSKAMYFAVLLTVVLVPPMRCRAAEKSVNDMPETLMKIITYNVLYGFNHQKSVKDGADWIDRQNPDVLAWQELNGFTQQKLKKMAIQWKHNHAVILKETGFPVGLTSKTPIETMEKRTRDFTHGYLHCRTAGIHFLVVHLDPHSYLRRQEEADIIVEKVKRLLAGNKYVVVLGDFNSLSSSDKGILNEKSDLLESQKKSKNLNKGQFDYTVMERFKEAGLIDICDRYLARADTQRFTFPTKIITYATKEESQKKFSRRIDYILLDQNSAAKCTLALIPREEILDSISDHFPVIITIRRPGGDVEQENPPDRK